MAYSFPGALEHFLNDAAASWHRPSKREFFAFFGRWRDAFEGQLASGPPKMRGTAAMNELEARLPADLILFHEPTYRYLPSGTSGPAFAMDVQQLRLVDRGLFNSLDLIVADTHARFCCLYTHEIGALAEPWFVEV